jgi:hypothetical protein
MKIERIIAPNNCSKCGGINLLLKLSVTISKNFLPLFQNNGFKEQSHFTNAGILYVENQNLTVHGPFGSDKLHVKCKKSDCQEILNNLEALLQQLG